jgi:hypothetical protein
MHKKLRFTQNDSFGKNCGAKNLLRILQNVIEERLIKWRVLSLVKINTPISGTSCIFKNYSVKKLGKVQSLTILLNKLYICAQ